MNSMFPPNPTRLSEERSWPEIFRGISTKKEKEAKKKEIFGRGGLLKLPQLRKSTSDAFGSFFLLISTSCLDKPSEKTCSAYPQFQQARRRLIINSRSLSFVVSHPRGAVHTMSNVFVK